MIKLWIKHKLCEICIDKIFDGIFTNFVLPKIIPQFSVVVGDKEITISDGKHEMTKKYDSSHEAIEIIYTFIEKYYSKLMLK